MTQEGHLAGSTRISDTTEFEDEQERDEEEEDSDAQTFGLDYINSEFCGNCRRRTLKEDKLDGFFVLYCTHCKKYVCPECLFPELKLYSSNGKSGLYCSKIPNSTNANCGKRFIHT